ncbi:MAG: alpha-2-macroglobulin family protein, partial [Bacteroidota bacterium]
EKGADQLKIETNNYRRYSRDRSYEKDQFFTDRGIYRPGQPLYFKGIALQFDNEDCPSTQPNVSRTVTLFDANGQAVQEKTFTADTYGSFNGSFTLPTGGLNGRFRIASTHGAANFRVEAYKRPRFEVTFPDEQRTVAANETVTVTGKAMGYAGPPVAGAKVTYRVERKQQLYAWFSYYRYGGRAGDDAVITTGTTTTQEDGSFAIEFTAQVPPGDGQSYFRPSYQFVVSVDVADQTGETHNATTQLGVRQKGSAIGFTTPSLIDKDWKDFKINVNFVGDEAVPEKAINLSLQRVIHPNPAQLSRKWAFPDRPTISKEDFAAQFPLLPATKTPPVEEWKTVGGVTIERDIVVNSDTSVRIATDELAAGYYRIIIQYTDDSGEAQQRDYQLSVLNSSTNELPANMLYFFVPGEDGDYPVGRTIEQKLIAQMPLNAIFNSWGSRGIRTSLVTATNGKRLDFNYTPTKDDRGGISFKYAFVYHNRFFEQQASYRVPWREKELQITYETFRDKLRPGDQEEWRILIKDHNGQPVASQALASMYDASLDQILPFNWQQNLQLFPQNYYATIQFQPYQFRVNSTYGEYINKGKQERYLNFIPPSLDVSPLQLNAYGRISSFMDQAVAMEAAPASAPPPGRARSRAINSPESYTASAKAEDSAYSATVPEPSSSATVSIRKNLQETAFWQPALRTDADGNLVVSFKAPEALTRWKLQLFAHTPELANAYSSKEIVTQKELMILPNAPRFLREGDQIQFTAKVSNLAESSLTGVAYLELFDPETEAIIQDFKVAGIMQSASPGRSSHEIPVSLASEESKTVAWNITVPANAAGLIGYRVVVKAGNYSDGEQNVLPVLTNRVFLTASKPFYLKPGAKKTITLDALKNAASSRGNLQHQGFSFELTNDPSWLVVKSLPYLMEYPHQCAEQLANRYFANQLSYTIVNKNPALREVFKAWQKDPDALNSPLLRNQKLKQAAIEETPWLREAQDESKQNERLAVLFDLNQLAAEQETTLRLLEQRQHQNGSFSWFPGGPDNGYMSQYVAETMIRLEQLGALEEETRSRALNIARKTFDYLDFKMAEQYQRYLNNSKPKDRANYRPGTGILHYLYVRTIQFPGQQAIHPETQEAFDFYYGQAEKYWTEYGLYAQALLAITFQNKGSAKGREIVESLRERAIRKDEMGMYWKYPRGYSWQQLPIETHGRIMEAFAVHGAPSNELDEMRLYLLQNKRTNRWETTKATAAAAYAFLQTEGNTLQNTQEQAVKVNFPAARKSSYTTALAEAQASREAGTGYYRMQLPADEVSDKLAEVALKNKGKRIAWGGLHWQFTQDIDAVQANPDNPLGLQRKLFRRVNTASGQRLVEITEKNPIQAGDRLVVKLVITADRDMEYVHLKDRRAAGLEPTEQLSRYRYEGGLGFYFSPDDLAVHFFFDYLPRGTYTLEYDTFVNHAGDFSNGLSVLQSMYAPEFSTYSAGSRLVVE